MGRRRFLRALGLAAVALLAALPVRRPRPGATPGSPDDRRLARLLLPGLWLGRRLGKGHMTALEVYANPLPDDARPVAAEVTERGDVLITFRSASFGMVSPGDIIPHMPSPQVRPSMLRTF
jgi:hypothetical protein